MAAGSTSILKYFRPVGSLSSLTTPTLPDPDGPLSERVPDKAIDLANAKVKQSKESSCGQRPPRGCCFCTIKVILVWFFRYLHFDSH